MAESMKTVRFADLWSAWPVDGTRDLAKALGGDAERALLRSSGGDDAKGAAVRDDDSVVRLSAAFNKTGHPVPRSTVWSGVELVDCDGFHLIADFGDMLKTLDTKFGGQGGGGGGGGSKHGKKHIHSKADVAGKRGILVFEGVKSIKDSGGHVDLWDGAQTASVMGDYWTESDKILFYPME
jgi:hypothetical protein